MQLGLQNLVQKGDENGIWDVVCCASAAHAARVNELEDLRVQVNGYKEKEQHLQKGIFNTEDSRIDQSTGKRNICEQQSTDSEQPNDIWTEFQNVMSTVSI